jgi:very-short-patch-repair endonuclease
MVIEQSLMDRPYDLAERISYPFLKKEASDMRKNPTEAESILWRLIRKKQLGVRFNRQYVIDTYVVDFVCLEKQLILEVDGKYHSSEEQLRWDEQRTDILNNLGFEVLRFKNEEVLCAPESVILQIKQALDKTSIK